MGLRSIVHVSYRKDAEIQALTARIEDEQSLVSRLQRQVKELQVGTRLQ